MSRTKRQPMPVTQSNPDSQASEAYHTIRTNIQFRSKTHGSQVILVASANSGEGRTTTACNLAVTLSQAGQRVLLVDADMRNPDIHTRFRVTTPNGLGKVLSENKAPEYTVVSDIPYLRLLAGEEKVINPAPLLSMTQFDSFMKQARREFDVVIVDSPAILSASDALVISRIVDGVVFVVDAGKTSRVVAQKALEKLLELEVHIIGGILNRVPKHARKYPIGATLQASPRTTQFNL